MDQGAKVKNNSIEETFYFKVAQDFLHKVQSVGIPVEQAFLFGSYAKGTPYKWSDLDICVISPVFGQDRLGERVRLMNLRRGISDLIEPHPYSPEDFQNRFDPLAAQIKATGIRLT